MRLKTLKVDIIFAVLMIFSMAGQSVSWFLEADKLFGCIFAALAGAWIALLVYGIHTYLFCRKVGKLRDELVEEILTGLNELREEQEAENE